MGILESWFGEKKVDKEVARRATEIEEESAANYQQGIFNGLLAVFSGRVKEDPFLNVRDRTPFDDPNR